MSEGALLRRAFSVAWQRKIAAWRSASERPGDPVVGVLAPRGEVLLDAGEVDEAAELLRPGAPVGGLDETENHGGRRAARVGQIVGEGLIEDNTR